MELCGSKVQLAPSHRNLSNGIANHEIVYKIFRMLENHFVKFLMLWQFHIICYGACVKKKKSEMSFKFSIGPSHPISEIATSHVCKLKGLKTRVIKNLVLL